MVCNRMAAFALGDDGQRQPEAGSRKKIGAMPRFPRPDGNLALGQLPFVAEGLRRFCLRFIGDHFPGVLLSKQRTGQLVVQAVA